MNGTRLNFTVLNASLLNSTRLNTSGFVGGKGSGATPPDPEENMILLEDGSTFLLEDGTNLLME